MKPLRHVPAPGHTRARGSLPFGRRPPSLWQRLQRGQTLVMFALSIVMLFGLAGLAIDIVRAYDLFAREHRAAEAGALAGVLYMPCFYNSTTSGGGCGPGNSPDGNTAITRALLEVQKNGFTGTPPSTCTGADASAAVTVCTTTVSTTALEVTITQPINVFFLSVLGISAFNVTATAAADYLPPTILGSDPSSGGNVWGAGGVSNPKTFLDVINGPAEFQEQGDPFVYCQDGATTGPPADADFSTLPYALQDTATGTIAGPSPAGSTNHQPFGGGPKCGGNKDASNLQPPGFGGQVNTNSDVYDFLLSTPTAPADVYIWNPAFDPSDAKSSCNGAQTPDVFFVDQACNSYYQQYGPITLNSTPNFDDPRLYFDMTYSVYSVAPAYGGPGGLAFSQTYHPIDAFPNDTAKHCLNGSGSGGSPNGYPLPLPPLPEGSVYDGPLTTVAVCPPLNGPGFMVGQWAKIGSVLAGTYRLTAEATPTYLRDGCGSTYITCGWGRHTYSIAVCAVGNVPSKNSCTAPAGNSFVAPLNDADFYLNFPSGTQNGTIPIAWIPQAFAGRTITFSVFNAGYTRANAPNSYFTIVPPDCSPITIPSGADPNWYRVTTSPGTPSGPPTCGKGGGPYNWVFASAKGKGSTTYGDFIYHGLWIDIPVTIPSNYTGGQWWFNEQVSGGAKDFGQFALKASISGGSPIHLIL